MLNSFSKFFEEPRSPTILLHVVLALREQPWPSCYFNKSIFGPLLTLAETGTMARLTTETMCRKRHAAQYP